MKRKRRTPNPDFKEKAAFEALKGDLTLAELEQKHDTLETPLLWQPQIGRLA